MCTNAQFHPTITAFNVPWVTQHDITWLAASHFTSGWSKTDPTTTILRRGRNADWCIWYNGGTFGWYSVVFSLILSSGKPDRVWPESFRSSLSKNFLSGIFFLWKKRLDWSSDKISWLSLNLKSKTTSSLKIPGTLTLHISSIYWKITQLVTF